jgi:hypothetical protein
MRRILKKFLFPIIIFVILGEIYLRNIGLGNPIIYNIISTKINND